MIKHPSHSRYDSRRLREALPRWRRAFRLRKRGLKFWQIGHRLNISASQAAKLVTKFETVELAKRLK